MRLSSVFTLLCALAALILSMLCLFAGYNRSFLQNGELLTLNVSRLGHGEVFNTTDGDGGFFDNLVNSAQDELNDLIADAASDVASALNISDFYSVHIMNYCEGLYAPNASVAAENGTGKVHENVTHCSAHNALFHFNPTQILEDNLPDGITLQDLQWPSEIQDAEKAIRVASMVMFVFYVIGIVFAGLAVFAAIWGIFSSGRLSACANFLLDILAFLTIGIASAIATAIIVKAVNAINKYGNGIGIAATKGTLFLGMTWAATAVMLLAAIMSVVQCCAGRRKSRTYGEKGRY